MKKIIALTLIVTACVSAFAEHTLGIGFSMPIASYKVEYDDTTETDTFKENGYDFTFTYIFVSDESGFSLKIDESLGTVKSKDFDDIDKILGDSSNFNDTFNIGLGFAPIHNERFTLSVLGSIGFNLSNYAWSKTIGQYKLTADCLLFTFNFGGEVFGIVRFTDHFGAFGSLALRMPVGAGALAFSYPKGALSDNSNYKDWSFSVNGSYVFTPSFGLTWTF